MSDESDNVRENELQFKCSAAVNNTPADSSVSLCIAPCDHNEVDRVLSKKSIPYLNLDEVSYEAFFKNFLLKNVPCMFAPSLTDNWLSRRLWFEGGECMNSDVLLDIYKDATVSVVNCNDSEYKEGYGSRDCRDMKFSEYMEYMQEKAMSPQNSNEQGPCWYLKDWHIVRFHKSREEGQEELPYQCPTYFQSDWLNEYCEDKNLNDYKFCYIGPKGTFTSFHADVYGSYSWSANVSGIKKWYLYPPSKEMQFYNSCKKKMAFQWDNPGVPGQDFVEVIQKSGECIFVPSGWHHVVWNLTDAFSINHNWFNGANICFIWNVLQNALKEVERELEDLRDIPEFNEQCQLVLKANHGMNYDGFFDILTHIHEKRLEHQLKMNTGEDLSWQMAFDISAISHVMQEHCLQDMNVQNHFTERIRAFTTRRSNK